MEDNYLQKSRKKPFWSYIFFVLGVLLLIFILSATLFSLIFFQSVDESLDIRKQALVINKRVDFDTYPFSQSFFKVHEPSQIELQINTYNHFIDALELRLQIKTDLGLWQESDLKINESRDKALKLVQANIQQVNCDPQHDCYLLALLLISNQASVPFTSRNVSTSIANLTFIPQKEGAIALELIQTSQVTEHATNQNILQNLSPAEFNYYVSNNGIDFAQCRYAYAEWSECKNFWQTRQYQVAPLNCHWYQTETLEAVSRQCKIRENNKLTLADPEDFFLHHFATCLSDNNQGENFYLVWNIKQFPEFDYLDISLDHRFTTFYQKSSKTAEIIDDYAIIDLTGFIGFSQNVRGQTLNFLADQNYYFRLYNDQTGEFVFGPKLYLNYCNQEQSRRLDCQDSCIQTEQGSNCLDGLSCINARCLLQSNPQNQYCFNEKLISEVQSLGAVAGVSTQIADTNIITQGPFLPSEVYDLTTYACNHGCNTNRDCMADYRCYQGRCRLASNPESPTCEAADVVKSTELIEQKGIGLEDEQTIIKQLSPTATGPTVAQKTEEELATSSATEETTAAEVNQAKQGEEAVEKSSPTIFANIFAKLSVSLNNFSNNFNWQYLALAGLLIIIAIVFIFLALSKDPRQSKKKLDKTKRKKGEKNKELDL